MLKKKMKVKKKEKSNKRRTRRPPGMMKRLRLLQTPLIAKIQPRMYSTTQMFDQMDLRMHKMKQKGKNRSDHRMSNEELIKYDGKSLLLNF